VRSAVLAAELTEPGAERRTAARAVAADARRLGMQRVEAAALAMG
jgi:hypothetical protein